MLCLERALKMRYIPSKIFVNVNGKLSFKQCTLSKWNRFNIKFFVLCDKKSGLTQDFKIYDGSLTNIPKANVNIGKSGTTIVPWKLWIKQIDDKYGQFSEKKFETVQKVFFHLLDISIWNAYYLCKLKIGKQISSLN